MRYIISLLAFFLSASAHAQITTETQEFVERWIAKNRQTADCHTEESAAAEIYVSDMQPYDFNHDGKDELVITASTCWTGTAGPDVKTVLSPTQNGEFTEWPLPDLKKKSYDRAKFEGNRNFHLFLEKGMVIARWYDQSGSPAPLTVTYKWNGKAFKIVDVKYK